MGCFFRAFFWVPPCLSAELEPRFVLLRAQFVGFLKTSNRPLFLAQVNPLT
jgi:hypothetical protein